MSWIARVDGLLSATQLHCHCGGYQAQPTPHARILPTFTTCHSTTAAFQVLMLHIQHLQASDNTAACSPGSKHVTAATVTGVTWGSAVLVPSCTRRFTPVCSVQCVVRVTMVQLRPRIAARGAVVHQSQVEKGDVARVSRQDKKTTCIRQTLETALQQNRHSER